MHSIEYTRNQEVLRSNSDRQLICRNLLYKLVEGTDEVVQLERKFRLGNIFSRKIYQLELRKWPYEREGLEVILKPVNSSDSSIAIRFGDDHRVIQVECEVGRFSYDQGDGRVTTFSPKNGDATEFLDRTRRYYLSDEVTMNDRLDCILIDRRGRQVKTGILNRLFQILENHPDLKKEIRKI